MSVLFILCIILCTLFVVLPEFIKWILLKRWNAKVGKVHIGLCWIFTDVHVNINGFNVTIGEIHLSFRLFNTRQRKRFSIHIRDIRIKNYMKTSMKHGSAEERNPQSACFSNASLFCIRNVVVHIENISVELNNFCAKAKEMRLEGGIVEKRNIKSLLIKAAAYGYEMMSKHPDIALKAVFLTTEFSTDWESFAVTAINPQIFIVNKHNTAMVLTFSRIVLRESRFLEMEDFEMAVRQALYDAEASSLCLEDFNDVVANSKLIRLEYECEYDHGQRRQKLLICIPEPTQVNWTFVTDEITTLAKDVAASLTNSDTSLGSSQELLRVTLSAELTEINYGSIKLVLRKILWKDIGREFNLSGQISICFRRQQLYHFSLPITNAQLLRLSVNLTGLALVGTPLLLLLGLLSL